MFELNRVSQNVGQPSTTEGGDKHYRHQQTMAAIEWICRHNLNKYPSLQIVDSAMSVFQGDIKHIDLNTTVITFTSAFCGEAHFN